MDADESTNVSIPRGGPVFVPKLTSGLTSVPDFECAIFHELEDLKAELQPESSFFADEEEDISVDGLKVFTDEELISEAMKEEFKRICRRTNILHNGETVPLQGRRVILKRLKNLLKSDKGRKRIGQQHNFTHTSTRQ